MSTEKSKNEVNVSLYKKIYLIRKSEENIRDYYSENEMRTPMHMSMGGEAVSAGVVSALNDKGEFFGTYRSHALYLSVTEETEKFFAEMYGKETGTTKGKAGSMHLASPQDNLFVCSAVVATAIPVAAGTALANKMKSTDKIATVFFGDGAIDEGAFWETLNFSCLMKLPIIFVCEDNNLAIHTEKRKRHGYKSITEVVDQFKCNVYSSESTDVEDIYKLTEEAVKETEKTNRPSFLHLKYYRYLEHVGVGEDFSKGYRSIKEFNKWKEKDPVKVQRNKLIKAGLENEIKNLEEEIDNQIEESVKKAQKDKFPSKDELFKDIFYEE